MKAAMIQFLKAIRGTFKSKTMWTSLLVAILPFAEQLVGVTVGVSPVAGIVLGLVFAVLRISTNKPLSEK